MSDGWNPMSRKPAAFTPITCLGADGKEYAGLCFSTYRGEIIEPITNKAAEPIIGPIQSWKYEPEDYSGKGQLFPMQSRIKGRKE